MIRLVLAEVQDHLGSWLWTMLVVATGTAALGAILGCSLTAEAAAAGDAQAQADLAAVTGTVTGFVVIAGCAVVATIAGLTVATRARAYALWKVLGMRERTLRHVVRGQLVVVGALGGLAGIPATLLLAPAYLSTWVGLGLVPAGSTPDLPWTIWPAYPLVGSGLALLGGLGLSRRISRTPEMQALREAAVPRSRTGIVQLGIGGVLLLGLVMMPLMQFMPPEPGPNGQPADPPPTGVEVGVGMSTLMMMLALVLAPWTVRGCLWLWTSAVPRRWVVWHTAVQTARAHAAQSVTTILPFAMAMSMTGVLFGSGNMSADEVSVDEMVVALGLVLLVCWVAGVAAIAMVGRQRTRDAALLTVTGARPRQVAVATLAEAVIQAGTAVIFSLALTLVAVVLTAVAGGTDLGQALLHGPWTELGVLALLTLATTGLTVLWPAVVAGRADPVPLLRQPV